MHRVFLVLLLFVSSQVFARSLDAPTVNPHPPKTAEDKKWIAFAERAIHAVLEKKLPDALLELSPDATSVYHDKTLECLQSESCLGSDGRFLTDLRELQEEHGLIRDYRFPHVVNHFPKTPAAKIVTRSEDEILQEMAEDKKTAPVYAGSKGVRFYGLFTNHEGWYPVDLVMKPSKKGLTLQQVVVP